MKKYDVVVGNYKREYVIMAYSSADDARMLAESLAKKYGCFPKSKCYEDDSEHWFAGDMGVYVETHPTRTEVTP